MQLCAHAQESIDLQKERKFARDESKVKSKKVEW